MLNFDLYSINTEKDERRSSDDELFLTFEDAMANRMRFANWWRPNGDIWIHKYPANSRFSYSEVWHIDKDGNIVSHYKFN